MYSGKFTVVHRFYLNFPRINSFFCCFLKIYRDEFTYILKKSDNFHTIGGHPPTPLLVTSLITSSFLSRENLFNNIYLTNCSLSLPSDLLLFQKDKKVPTILPPDVRKPMEWICDRDLRAQFHIDSKFVFAAKTGKENLQHIYC